ncbi:hypothetical protein PsorP6_016756 [Peronosclerospora sorghi]|uniref:Uncharacterized protein n=1 Tax=Peronosclerospora sorghi TaxID=230839 RepID=A0ACC0WES6_9STRA|nr:hypothetical protein PsorP6_016756 [Peronosclerospora sorghi]
MVLKYGERDELDFGGGRLVEPDLALHPRNLSGTTNWGHPRFLTPFSHQTSRRLHAAAHSFTIAQISCLVFLPAC